MRRTAFDVAAQAIIDGCLGFRSSLEVTEHPRTKSICSQLLPWLDQLGIGARVDPFYRELLETPHGDLPQELRAEAFWRGEAAWLLGWAIQLFDKPEANVSIDPALLLSDLRILQPTAGEMMTNAKLRPQVEIDDYCALCIAVRSQRQIAAVSGEAQATLRRIHQIALAELGLSEALNRIQGLDLEAAKVAAAPPDMKFQYVVRAMTAEWLLGKDW